MRNSLDDLARPYFPLPLPGSAQYLRVRRWARLVTVLGLCGLTFFVWWGDDLATLWLLLRVLNDD